MTDQRTPLNMVSDRRTPEECRMLIRKMFNFATGRMRIEGAEQRLQVKVPEIFGDDDLVVIFFEEAMKS